MAFRGWPKEEIRLPDGRTAQAVCPVIISASRATDIPAFFSEWFAHRLRAGYAKRKNPFARKQDQHISFSRARVIIFWSKNPAPLLRCLPEVDAAGLNYYVQFTLNHYELEGLEPHVPPLIQRIETFRNLAEKIGKKRVIWRFDPLLLANTLTVERLMDRIAEVAAMIRGCTERLVISFADINIYRKVQRNLARARVNYREFTPDLMVEAAERLRALNREWGLKISACAERMDLTAYGIEPSRCVDDRLMREVFSSDTDLMKFLGDHDHRVADGTRSCLKDKGQRQACECIVSKDIGSYDTCEYRCAYCYATG